MTIKIEVTGESLLEVSDKLLAIGASLRGDVSPATAPNEAAKPAEKAKPAPKPKAAKEAAKEDVGEPSPAAPAAEAESSETAASSTSAPAKQAEPSTPSATDVPDYDTVVSPLVLEAVKKAGRDAVLSVFAEYGVSKAAEVADERLGEFVTRLNDLIAEA